MSWYDNSISWIEHQKEANPSLTREELKKYCSEHYPYAMRRGYAYKAWLRAMNYFFGKRDTSNNMDLFK